MSSIALPQQQNYLSILRTFCGFLLAIFSILFTYGVLKLTTSPKLWFINLLIFTLPLTTLSVTLISNSLNELTKKEWSLRIGIGFSLLSFAYLMLGYFFEHDFGTGDIKQFESFDILFPYLIFSIPLNGVCAAFIGRYIFNSELLCSEKHRIRIAIGSAVIPLLSLAGAAIMMSFSKEFPASAFIIVLHIGLPTSIYSMVIGISNLIFRRRKLSKARSYGQPVSDNSLLNKIYPSVINIVVGLIGIAINISLIISFIFIATLFLTIIAGGFWVG